MKEVVVEGFTLMFRLVDIFFKKLGQDLTAVLQANFCGFRGAKSL